MLLMLGAVGATSAPAIVADIAVRSNERRFRNANVNMSIHRAKQNELANAVLLREGHGQEASGAEARRSHSLATTTSYGGASCGIREPAPPPESSITGANPERGQIRMLQHIRRLLSLPAR